MGAIRGVSRRGRAQRCPPDLSGSPVFSGVRGDCNIQVIDYIGKSVTPENTEPSARRGRKAAGLSPDAQDSAVAEGGIPGHFGRFLFADGPAFRHDAARALKYF